MVELAIKRARWTATTLFPGCGLHETGPLEEERCPSAGTRWDDHAPINYPEMPSQFAGAVTVTVSRPLLGREREGASLLAARSRATLLAGLAQDVPRTPRAAPTLAPNAEVARRAIAF